MDVAQGSVGDCWLLAAFSAFAEYRGAVEKLFRNTPGLCGLPAGPSNMYAVTLYDLKTWTPVDITVDERLSTTSDGKLLGCSPTSDGKLWACYLEKAVAIHCAGWDQIDGGHCEHAWRMMTGCAACYRFYYSGNGFGCFGPFNPHRNSWEPLDNHGGDDYTRWPMAWPEAGGGGHCSMRLRPQQLFERMCAWDDNNYLMAAGTKSKSDTEKSDGIVVNHAYTILECSDNAGGTQFDMIKLRNPWGKDGEFDKGIWGDDGPGWEWYPSVKEACSPDQANDGVFWMASDEFFKYFPMIYLCAQDMNEFVQSLPRSRRTRI